MTQMTEGRRRFVKQIAVGAAGGGMALGGAIETHGMGDTLPGDPTMSLFEAVEKRVSVRQFLPEPVPQEHLDRILETARLAANSGNQQAWRFLVLKDRKRLDELKQKCIREREEALRARGQEVPPTEAASVRQYFEVCFSAPVYVLVLMDTTVRYKGYSDKDGALAAGHIMLAARALGYGTVFYTDSIPEELCREHLSIPARYSRTCIIPIGRPAEWPQRPSRKSLKELVFEERLPLE